MSEVVTAENLAGELVVELSPAPSLISKLKAAIEPHCGTPARLLDLMQGDHLLTDVEVFG